MSTSVIKNEGYQIGNLRNDVDVLSEKLEDVEEIRACEIVGSERPGLSVAFTGNAKIAFQVGELDSSRNYLQIWCNDIDMGYIIFDVSRR